MCKSIDCGLRVTIVWIVWLIADFVINVNTSILDEKEKEKPLPKTASVATATFFCLCENFSN